ncbi:MAG: NUDIX domain-containing protein [Candidatus Aenigmarchaeota archaeon]|nr:NUDIX domain-containing protein [Candidatus Aenigmarchaeota archaeon]
MHKSKVSLILIKNNKLLMLKERGLDKLKFPGGKPGPGEAELETLKREVREEIGVGVKSAKHFGKFTNAGMHPGDTINISAYFADVIGEPRPAECGIERLVWVSSKDINEGISSPVGMDVLRELMKQNYLK